MAIWLARLRRRPGPREAELQSIENLADSLLLCSTTNKSPMSQIKRPPPGDLLISAKSCLWSAAAIGCGGRSEQKSRTADAASCFPQPLFEISRSPDHVELCLHLTQSKFHNFEI